MIIPIKTTQQQRNWCWGCLLAPHWHRNNWLFVFFISEITFKKKTNLPGKSQIPVPHLITNTRSNRILRQIQCDQACGFHKERGNVCPERIQHWTCILVKIMLLEDGLTSCSTSKCDRPQKCPLCHARTRSGPVPPWADQLCCSLAAELQPGWASKKRLLAIFGLCHYN